jgi:hypothetical protein
MRFMGAITVYLVILCLLVGSLGAWALEDRCQCAENCRIRYDNPPCSTLAPWNIAQCYVDRYACFKGCSDLAVCPSLSSTPLVQMPSVEAIRPAGLDSTDGQVGPSFPRGDQVDKNTPLV